MTVAIEMGHTTAGAPATLDLEELLATRLLVQGNSGSGKSHLLRRLLEQSAPWVQQTIIDPEGDFVALADRFGHLVINAEEHAERGLQVAGERARIHRVSTVVNLEDLDAENLARMRNMLLAMDPPRHLDYRRPLANEFKAKVIDRLEDQVRDICRRIMADAVPAASRP